MRGASKIEPEVYPGLPQASRSQHRIYTCDLFCFYARQCFAFITNTGRVGPWEQQVQFHAGYEGVAILNLAARLVGLVT
jgi:hypothetical protein